MHMFPTQHGPNERSVKHCFYLWSLLPFIYFTMKTNFDIFFNPAEASTKFFMKQNGPVNFGEYKTFFTFCQFPKFLFFDHPVRSFKLVLNCKQVLEFQPLLKRHAIVQMQCNFSFQNSSYNFKPLVTITINCNIARFLSVVLGSSPRKMGR